MTVELRGVTRRFGDIAALQDVTLAAAPGEFLALLGPSGSGKTTLLRILAGLDFPDEGEVLIAGRDVARVPARERGVGVVLQHYALFRHMTVFENVAFGLRVRPRRTRPSEDEIMRRVGRLLDLVQIPELSERWPDQLSGGQRQRVALARALAIEPPLLLLDEPFAALDALVRKEVRRWVRGLHDRVGLTSVLVTHDQEEAMEMADRVAVMDQGRIVQCAEPDELLAQPASPFVAGFLGETNRLRGEVRAGWLHLPGIGRAGPLDLADGEAEAFVRPGDLQVRAATEGAARVRACRPSPAGGNRVLLETDSALLEGVSPERLDRGSPCEAVIAAAIVFGANGDRVLFSAVQNTVPAG
ncbi:sulfate/molybdate ABC transporter ATP-binding protein [Sabulicella rubraurantiaca]|uniref:sulfate/molybdate ABC transporter ATP-binding protein n=1 Tax=Sabulicella rubraurantiaca TaxID=2811429 RepID=UPI001A971350|nr:ATP-binding cassette domain-containing protein [Sabulicella rubraurantiaca]